MARKRWLAVIVAAVFIIGVVNAAIAGGKRAESPSNAFPISANPTTVPLLSSTITTAPGTTSTAMPSSASFLSPSSTTATPTSEAPGSNNTIEAAGAGISSRAHDTPARAPDGVLEVHFVDVGQGDCFLIVGPGGETVLIDGGEAGSGALTYLQKKGIERLDLMVATHPHADHIGGLVDVLRAIPVAKVVTNGAMHTTRTFERFLDAIFSAEAVFSEAERGDVLSLGSLAFQVLGSDACAPNDLNEGSLVLRLVYGEVAFLFTADTGRESEARMMRAGENLVAQILKVGHHGSSTSSSPSFLSVVRPQVAIYSCGAGNSYGHPHAQPLTALAAAGATVYGTDQNGTIVVTSDGQDFKVVTERDQARAPPKADPAVSPDTAGPTGIEVLSLTSPIPRGTKAELTIKTTPGAQCSIVVRYKSGPSKAAGLGDQTAGSSGKVTWRWNVGANTTPGIWRIVIGANVDGRQEKLDIPFEVTQ